MLSVVYWVLGIAIAIAVVALALVARFVLYGIGLILVIVIIGGIIATGLKEHYRNKKPLD